MRLYLGSWLVLVVVALPVALLSCAKDDDPVPPRQDGWIVYRNRNASMYDCVLGVAIDPLGGKWIDPEQGISYLDDKGTPLQTSESRG